MGFFNFYHRRIRHVYPYWMAPTELVLDHIPQHLLLIPNKRFVRNYANLLPMQSVSR